jgi:hypothetical protein
MQTVTKYTYYNDNNILTLQIKKIGNDVKQIINNFDKEIEVLTIFINYNKELNLLCDNITNLPNTIKKISFVYCSNFVNIVNYINNGTFNILFNIKLPFNCVVELLFNEIIYTVEYNINYIKIKNNFEEYTIHKIDKPTYPTQIKFNHPVKEILWAMDEKKINNNNFVWLDCEELTQKNVKGIDK